MRATIKALDELVQNPPAGLAQVFNGRPAYDRLKEAHEQATARVRQQQVERYEAVRQQAADLIAEDTAAVGEVLGAVRALRRDLKRGLVTPDEVMHQVAVSMKGTEDLVEHVRQVERDEEAATSMVDTAPEAYQAEILDRFPSQGVPELTEEYLRGEAPSPFLDRGGEE